ncbi:hypothetical protein EVAR_8627_1 [Eumeta japonica]|uniref:Uncharacterized protein n=1 Tax=Eumeta variegata TaxID=151549 RepID=A0A4C1TUQ1_EUMVA|nr:hypothetical protein EVAR_8627_1 [Eumeta japonica]
MTLACLIYLQQRQPTAGPHAPPTSTAWRQYGLTAEPCHEGSGIGSRAKRGVRNLMWWLTVQEDSDEVPAVERAGSGRRQVLNIILYVCFKLPGFPWRHEYSH